ncbi:hypothetical protein NE237_002438 [Protea cynaroides]|uniref:Endoplasmic reticulum-Golgi intermediate compartment protein 3 n=1 Tax=Protea cynaroides TaxID=273540 RepID=A0A9Q0KV11_9MAGN|nr:hypothetical protein NE237_002438 [Protea cynaroides]
MTVVKCCCEVSTSEGLGWCLHGGGALYKLWEVECCKSMECCRPRKEEESEGETALSITLTATVVKMRVKQVLKAIDAFPRAEDHLLQKTQSGAVVSIVGLIIMATLFLHELKYYLTTYTVHQMSVDMKRGETLPIHVNISFPSLPCDVLSIDAVDMSGKNEVDIDTNIWKLRLNRDGHIIGTEYLSDLVEGGYTHKHDHDKEHHEDSLQKPLSHDQDVEKKVKNVKQALENGEGCRVFGVLDVQRVAGNFHISVHGLNIFVAQQIFEGAIHVNVSHVIHDLSFGPKYPGIHNPLDGTVRILQGTSGTFKYYIKIVPTEYRYLSKEVLPTNQFSVMEYFAPTREFDRMWPAVYFLYDLSPITVTIREERRSFLHFITRLCAVLGGTFALTGMLDRWMYRLLEALTKSRDIQNKQMPTIVLELIFFNEFLQIIQGSISVATFSTKNLGLSKGFMGQALVLLEIQQILYTARESGIVIEVGEERVGLGIHPMHCIFA